MVILCVHIVELTFFPFKTLHLCFDYPMMVDALANILVTLTVTWFILKSQFVRTLFCIKR